MQPTTIGNKAYAGPGDLPAEIPLFPLSGALLLPRGQLPLNIFEPRYLAMVDAVLGGDRVIGMIQPRGSGEAATLEAVGCAGRLTSFTETGDGRYLVTLVGICRFRVIDEVASARPYRIARVSAEGYAGDFVLRAGEEAVDRAALLVTFRAYLEANGLEADWDSVERATTEQLVNALSMMSPFGPAEKQALLEAGDLKTRADTLVAITEMSMARAAGRDGPPLQ